MRRLWTQVARYLVTVRSHLHRNHLHNVLLLMAITLIPRGVNLFQIGDKKPKKAKLRVVFEIKVAIWVVVETCQQYFMIPLF